MSRPTIEDIELARRRLSGVVKPTPLIRSAMLERMKLLAEGAGAAALAGALKIRNALKGRRVAIGAAHVTIELETRGPEHLVAIRDRLRQRGYRIGTEEADAGDRIKAPTQTKAQKN